MRELVGTQGERMSPVAIGAQHAATLCPSVVAVVWPGGTGVGGQGSGVGGQGSENASESTTGHWPLAAGHSPPGTQHSPRILRLDPLLAFRESELADELLFMNRDRNGKQVEYLSYTTGRTEKLKETSAALAELLAVLGGKGPGVGDQGSVAGEEVPSAKCQVPSGDTQHSASDTSPTPDPRPPTPDSSGRRLIGDYEILAEIGRGGMAIVYLARQLSLGRVVAMKMLPADLVGDELALARFRREMRALSRCDHPNIVRLLGQRHAARRQRLLHDGVRPGLRPGADLAGAGVAGGRGAAGDCPLFRHRDCPLFRQYGKGDCPSRWRGPTRGTVPISEKRLGNGDSPQRLGNGDSPLLRRHARRLDIHRGGPQPPAGGSWTRSRGTRREAGDRRNAESIPNSEFHIPHFIKGDPGSYVRKIVALIRDVAMALHSVHEQQVVHRDISPANMMLTSDGSRVVLMDFGLAKGTNASAAVSMAGGFAGKLRYDAAPEQLASAMVKVGPAADIRGLGVTLWELLTRRAAVRRRPGRAAVGRRMVMDKDVPRLRDVDRAFDADLEAIVARATERSASDRIRSAQKLAEYLDLYLQGKPLPIRPPTTGEMVPSLGPRAQAAGRRSRRRVRPDRRDRGRSVHHDQAGPATRAVDSASREKAAKEQAVKSAQQERIAKEQAREAEAAAELGRNIALGTLNRLVFEIQDKLSNRVGMHALRESLLQVALDDLQKVHESRLAAGSQPDIQQGYALMQLATLYQSTARIKDATRPLDSAREVFERAIRRQPDDLEARHGLIKVHALLANAHVLAGRSQQALEQAGRGLQAAEGFAGGDAESQRPLMTALQAMGDTQMALGRPADAITYYLRGMNICQGRVKAQPDNRIAKATLSEFYGMLGRAYSENGQTGLAQEFLAKDMEITEQLAKGSASILDQRNLAISLSRQSDLSAKMGGTKAAYDCLAKATELFKAIAAGQPDDTMSRDDYAQALIGLAQLKHQMGRPQAAMEDCREALAIRRQLAAGEPGNAHMQWRLATALNALGYSLVQLRQETQALANYQEALRIQKALADADPGSPQAQRDLSIGYNDFADVCHAMGAYGMALEYYQKGFDIRMKLARDNPANVQMQRDVVLAYCRLGDAHMELGDERKSADAFAESARRARLLMDADPRNTEAVGDLAVACYRLGALDERVGLALPASQPEARAARFNAAIRQFASAAQLYEKLAADAANAQARHDLGVANNRVGDLLRRLGKPAEAVAIYRKSLAAAGELAANKEDLDAQRDVWVCLTKVAVACQESRDFVQSAQIFAQALTKARQIATSRPADATAQSDLAKAFLAVAMDAAEAGRPTEAAAAYRQALAVLDRMDQAKILSETDRQLRAMIDKELKAVLKESTSQPE